MAENNLDNESNSDETFAFLNIIYLLADTKEFQKWLTDFHKLKNHDQIFSGYKFMVITCLLAFMNSFTMHDPFRLKEDEICSRAEFRGIKLERLPNSCEKIVFQKNVWQLGKKIRKASVWENLDIKCELSPLLELFCKIKENNISITKNVSKDSALTYLSEFYTYLFLIDTRHGRPHGYYHPFFSTRLSPKYLDEVFEGYVYSLQYLWYKLLGKERFLKSCVYNLHHCQEIQFQDKEKYSISIGKKLGKTYEIELEPEEKKEQEFKTATYNKWQYIDQFFEKIREEIIVPLQKKIEHRFGGLHEALLELNNFEKSNLGTLLDKDSLDEPEYMKKNDQESIKKLLDIEFLWYDIDVFDSGQASLEFNGVFAFNALLTGYVTILQEQDSEGKIVVIKIIHPNVNGNYNRYSLAILIGVSGLFSDASGWIVFYDCLIDSPGTGGHHRDMCFDCIDKFKKQSSVTLKEITIDKEKFQQYLESRKVSFSDTRELSAAYKDTKDNVSQMKGKLFEYVFLKYCIDNKEFDLVKGDFLVSGQQVDCIGIQNETIYVFECKLQFHEDDFQDYVSQVKRISDIVKKNHSNKKIIPSFVTYSAMREENILRLEKNGIRVIHNFRNKIQNDRIFYGERKKIMQMLDYDLKVKFYRNYDKDWFT